MRFNNLPIKLHDCHLHDIPSGAELFLVEGDSAALAVTRLRNAQQQAVLPMQGKPMNTLEIKESKLLENNLFKALVDAIGAGVGDTFDITKSRYQRIILLMDPDADGIHCGALMMMFFYRWMKPLLEKNRVAIARPPVGEMTNLTTSETQVLYTEAQFFTLLKQAEVNKEAIQPIKYRGLAGIPPKILDQTCIDASTRMISVMQVKDAEMAIAVFNPAET